MLSERGITKVKIPHHPFFLFGMGNRRKFLYKAGTLYDALTGEILRSWNPVHEQIVPHEYAVKWQTRDGRLYSLHEDEVGVFLQVEGTRTSLTEGPIHLPDFPDNGHGHVLKLLLHEVLVNIVEGKPLTNFLVQSRPTYRDAAVICECLRRTGNLELAKDWILRLNEPFDYAWEGKSEPDNLGEALFLLSLVADKEHPLVKKILEAVPAFLNTDYIEGQTEGVHHAVYQTKWLKHGLKSLGLPDPYKLPVAFDPHSSVFWMAYRDVPTNGPAFPEKIKETSPHLAWAEAHFHGWDQPMPLTPKAYPLSWEILGSRENPHGMALISKDFLEKKIVTPQARHAAEMLMYFLDQTHPGSRSEQDERLQHAH